MKDKDQAQGGSVIHERINTILFLVIVLPLTGVLLYVGQYFIAVGFPIGAAYGIWLVTPDAQNGFLSHTAEKWLRGTPRVRPLGYLLRSYYYPLAMLARLWDISHVPVFGSLMIYVYSWWLPAIVLLLTGWRPDPLFQPDTHVGLFCGLACAHVLYIVEDRFLTAWRNGRS